MSHARVTHLLEDQQGRFWVGTESGLNLMDRNTGTFKSFRHDPVNTGSLAHDYVTALYEDRAGTLWVGTRGGLNRFDEDRTGAVDSVSSAKTVKAIALQSRCVTTRSGRSLSGLPLRLAQ